MVSIFTNGRKQQTVCVLKQNFRLEASWAHVRGHDVEITLPRQTFQLNKVTTGLIFRR